MYPSLTADVEAQLKKLKVQETQAGANCCLKHLPLSVSDFFELVSVLVVAGVRREVAADGERWSLLHV